MQKFFFDLFGQETWGLVSIGISKFYLLIVKKNECYICFQKIKYNFAVFFLIIYLIVNNYGCL